MNFKNLLDSNLARAQTTTVSMQSFREYLDSFRNKLTRWASRTVEDSAFVNGEVTITVTDSEMETVQCTLSEEKYAEIQSTAYETYELVTDVTHETVTVSRDEVIDAVTAIGDAAQDSLYKTEVLTITAIDDVHGAVIAAITPEQYQDCLNQNVEYIEAKINDVGDTIRIEADVVIEKIEEMANEAVVQSAFLGECLDNLEVKADSFITKIKTLNDQVSGDMIMKYADLLKSGDPVESLQTLFSTVRLGTATQSGSVGHEFISIASANDFTGANILLVAWNNLWGKVTSFFNVAWEGILNIGNFIKKIFQGLVDCVKWLVKLVMKPLTTRYEKANAPIGIMDLPIAQFEFANVITSDNLNFTITDYTDEMNDMIEAWEESTTVYRPTSDIAGSRVLTLQQSGATYLANNKRLNVSAATDDGRFIAYFHALASACLEEVNGQYYFRPYDIVIPTDYWDVILRFGISENLKLTLAMYVAMPYSSITNLSDGEIYETIQYTAVGMINTVAKMFPISFGAGNTGYNLLWCEAMWLKENNDADNVDIVSLNYLFDNFTSNHSSVTPTASDNVKACWCYLLLNGILPYAVMMGPAYQNVLNNYHPGWANDFWVHKDDLLRFFLIDNSQYNIDSSSINNNPADYYDSWPQTLDIVEFRPFVQAQLYGVSVHYQTLDEAANELIKYIVIMVIAAAAVFVAVKFHSFKTKRKALGNIQQGYVDNMAWNLPQNPSKEQIKTYLKAKKKADNTARLNSILGLLSPGKALGLVKTAVGSVKDQLLATQGVDVESEENETFTLKTLQSSLKTLINDNQEILEIVEELLITVKDLIK